MKDSTSEHWHFCQKIRTKEDSDDHSNLAKAAQTVRETKLVGNTYKIMEIDRLAMLHQDSLQELSENDFELFKQITEIRRSKRESKRLGAQNVPRDERLRILGYLVTKINIYLLDNHEWYRKRIKKSLEDLRINRVKKMVDKISDFSGILLRQMMQEFQSAEMDKHDFAARLLLIGKPGGLYTILSSKRYKQLFSALIKVSLESEKRVSAEEVFRRCSIEANFDIFAVAYYLSIGSVFNSRYNSLKLIDSLARNGDRKASQFMQYYATGIEALLETLSNLEGDIKNPELELSFDNVHTLDVGNYVRMAIVSSKIETKTVYKSTSEIEYSLEGKTVEFVNPRSEEHKPEIKDDVKDYIENLLKDRKKREFAEIESSLDLEDEMNKTWSVTSNYNIFKKVLVEFCSHPFNIHIDLEELADFSQDIIDNFGGKDIPKVFIKKSLVVALIFLRRELERNEEFRKLLVTN